jgi:hypothetical protein
MIRSLAKTKHENRQHPPFPSPGIDAVKERCEENNRCTGDWRSLKDALLARQMM